MTDCELVLAAQAGDADAFGQLVVKHQQAAYGHAVALLGEREAAQDAVQDGFLAAFRALRRLDADRPFFPWFYVILRNRCYSILRQKRTTQPLDESCLPAADNTTSEDSARLRQALTRLPVEDREILVLKYFDGRRYRQIAQMVGIPVGTVTSRLHAARRRLRDQLRDDRSLEARKP